MDSRSRQPVTDSESKGFRLHRLEVLNWGTFDGHVYTVSPRGKSTLLIGQNGSGKSTLVDALLTLLVRPGVRNFNVAAGGKKRERDERSYLLGAYDRGNDDDGVGIRVKYLRKGDKYSVILACFRNDDIGGIFTAAQVLYLTGDRTVEKVYCFAEDERSIQTDFGQLESAEGILKVLRDRQLRVTRTFQEFEGWFNKVTRVKPKAMEVFNQTVAVKDIQRLNDFIRDHMLEPHDWRDKVDRLLSHFTQLSEAHDSLVRIRQQRDLLEPVARIGAEFRQHAEELERAEILLTASAAYFAQRTIDLLVPDIKRKVQDLEEIGRRKEKMNAEIRSLQESARSLRNEIDRVGGDRLKRIPDLINNEQLRLHATRKQHERYRQALEQLEINQEILDEASFVGVRSRIPAIEAALDTDILKASARHEEQLLKRGQVRQQLKDLREELDGLSRRRENIPEWCVQLRHQLCQNLGLDVRELPFAAELMQVHPKDRDWEASIEKVMRSLALSLLVPDKFYRLVATHVDRTRLQFQGRGQRLVYLRIAERESGSESAVPRPASVIAKLAFRGGHPLLPWLKAELLDRYDYTCCDTVEEFQECRGLAVTRLRHVKNGRQRHEKDDRDQVVDPRNFVLGWDNREKLKRLAAEIDDLTQTDTQLSQTVQAIERELARLNSKKSAVREALAVTSFADVDYLTHEQEIHRLEEERRAIENRSDALRVLRQRLAEVELQDKGLKEREYALVGDERELGNQINEAKKRIIAAETDLGRSAADGSLATYQSLFPDLDAEFCDPPLSPDNLFERRERFRDGQHTRISELRQQVEPIRNRLTDAMSRFLRACPEELADLQASADYLNSFLGYRQRIVEDDLPRHEQRFKERLNQKVIEEIGLFRSALEQERRRIQDKIELLNGSLRKLEYRDGMHIQLEPRPVRDAEVIDFQGRLRECVEGSFEDTAEANEARFTRIKELIERLRDDETHAWRDKVTDVRRWFDFVASVIDRQTNVAESVYQDSSGQSGGEKAKLAFTILVAAIAYQYDLEPGRRDSDRFHFVVVDEMFSKVDDRHAEYALDLFKQFGLQLLIVAPLDAKARVTQPYVGCYLHAVKKENRSELYEMTAQEFEEFSRNGELTGDLQASLES